MNKANLIKILSWLIVVLGLALLPLWVRNPYVLHIFIIMFLNMVYAIGLSMIYKAGSLSFGHAAYAGIGAYTSVFLVMKYGLSVWSGFFFAGATTAVMALFIGRITLGVRGIYFTITTFALTEVLRGVYTAYPDLFGGPGGIKGIPSFPGMDTKLEVYFMTFLFGLATFFIFYRISKKESYFGMMCDGLRLNELLEAHLGINTRAVRIVAFVLGCSFAGFAGSIYAHYMGQINPETFALHMSVDVIVFCAVGGFGSIPGAVLGAGVLTGVAELLHGVGAYKSLVFGFIVIFIVLFLPDGIMGLITKIRSHSKDTNYEYHSSSA